MSFEEEYIERYYSEADKFDDELFYIFDKEYADDENLSVDDIVDTMNRQNMEIRKLKEENVKLTEMLNERLNDNMESDELDCFIIRPDVNAPHTIILLIDKEAGVMWSFLSSHREAVEGVCKRLNELKNEVRELQADRDFFANLKIEAIKGDVNEH